MQLPPIPEDSAAAQRVDESGTHYAWFLTYLALERPRTSAAVAREIGRHETTVRKRAGQYAWRHRAELWEWERRQEQAADLRGMATQVAAETASAAWAHASNLRSRAYDLDPERIPPREVAPNLKSMSDVALDLGRYVADLEEQAAPVSAESRELAEQDPRQAATAQLAQFVTGQQGKAGERLQAARALLGLPEAEQDQGQADVVALIAGALGQHDENARYDVVQALITGEQQGGDGAA